MNGTAASLILVPTWNTCFTKNLGLGLGYLYFKADVERDREDMVSHLDYKYHGVKLYGILHF